MDTMDGAAAIKPSARQICCLRLNRARKPVDEDPGSNSDLCSRRLPHRNTTHTAAASKRSELEAFGKPVNRTIVRFCFWPEVRGELLYVLHMN